MSSQECVLCHPELYGKNKNWTVLCAAHMNQCLEAIGGWGNMGKPFEDWVRQQHQKITEAAK